MPDIRRSAGIALVLLLQNDWEGALRELNQHPLKFKDGEPWIELEEEPPPSPHPTEPLLERFPVAPMYQAAEKDFAAAVERYRQHGGFLPKQEG